MTVKRKKNRSQVVVVAKQYRQKCITISKGSYEIMKLAFKALLVQSAVHTVVSCQFINELHMQCLRHKVEQTRRVREACKRRRKRVRLNFNTFSRSISHKHFRRMFRMPLDCFHLLCEKIEYGVGEEEFLSEEYIKKELQCKKNKKGKMFRAHMKTTGGYLSGETKVAITLRLLGGGSFLDIATIFDVSYSTTYDVFHYVTENWFCNDWVAEYSLEKNLDDPEALYKTSTSFSAKGRSNGILGGIIGAIDGWLVKIKSPSYKRDGVRNSGTYFSRKGFFALNIQVIVDRDKRVLWRTINSKGSEHDSSAFKETELYTKLVNCFDKLKLNGLQLYLIGDSA